jgi:hypothetical protein
VDKRINDHTGFQQLLDRRSLTGLDGKSNLMNGIAMRCSSIVLSGGYVDDEDLGDVIIYTAVGGRDQRSGRQIADQQLTAGNLALAENHLRGIPIRVLVANLTLKICPKDFDGATMDCIASLDTGRKN